MPLPRPTVRQSQPNDTLGGLLGPQIGSAGIMRSKQKAEASFLRILMKNLERMGLPIDK